jgi:hypothetical protein
MGGLGGWLNERTRAVCGPTTHETTFGCHARVARRPRATNHNFPTLPAHAGGTDVTQPPQPRAGRANRCETRATSPPPTPYGLNRPRLKWTMPGTIGAAIRHPLMARDARHAIATNAGRPTFRSVYDGGMAAQRLAHKLPPGAPKTDKIAPIPTPQAVTLDGRVGRTRTDVTSTRYSFE